MEEAVESLFNENILREAVEKWQGNFNTLKLLGKVENYVYEAEKENIPFILRLTHSSHRNEQEVKAEIDWINYLSKNNLTVCKPILSINQKFTEIITVQDSKFIICTVRLCHLWRR